jgi:hypothetical protein
MRMSIFAPRRAGRGTTTTNSSGRTSRGSQFAEKAQTAPEMALSTGFAFETEKDAAERQRATDDKTRDTINDSIGRGMLTADDLRAIVAARTEDPAIKDIQRTTAASLFAYDVTDEYPRADHIEFSVKSSIPADLDGGAISYWKRTARVYNPRNQILAIIGEDDPRFGRALVELMPRVHAGTRDLGPQHGQGVAAFSELDEAGVATLDVTAALNWCPTEPLREPKRGIRGVFGR